jgi:hypothetical protein
MRTKSESETSANRAEIARLAQQIWEREGRQAGRDLEYWLQAERELLGRRNLASPIPASEEADQAARLNHKTGLYEVRL